MVFRTFNLCALLSVQQILLFVFRINLAIEFLICASETKPKKGSHQPCVVSSILVILRILVDMTTHSDHS